MRRPAGPQPTNKAALALRTLGDAGLYAVPDGHLVLGPGKPFALLVYLALAPGRRSSREFLLDILWADLDPDRARRALRQTLFHLRRLLGDGALQGSEELTLEQSVAIDRDEFLAALEHGELKEALARYPGAFLPTFGVPGGAAFEHWADLERDRLQTAYLRSAEIVVRRLLNDAQLREAQLVARRARDLVPQDEGAWRLVLESAIASRDFVAAAVEAEGLERLAETELGTLEASTRGMIARARGLSRDPEEPPEVDGLLVELTGREREFFSITSAWETSRNGKARHLHLSAPAGLGKSRLLRDACARLIAGGAAVVHVQGRPADRDVPFAFAGDLAAALLTLPGAHGIAPASAATLVALNPTLSSRFPVAADTAQGEEASRRRTHAIDDLLHAVGHEQPFVLVIDDLHWIDRSSWRILEGLFSRLAALPVLCLTAARPERQPSSAGCMLLPLPALSAEQLATLVAALGAVPEATEWATEFVPGLLVATGGSPLLVLETLRCAMDQRILSLDHGEWQCLDVDRLRALLQAGEALRERVRSLSAPASWLLGLLATAGAPLETLPLARAAALPSDEVLRILAPLEQQGLVSVDDTGWRVGHDEIADAVRDALPPERQQAADRAIGAHHAHLGNVDNLLRAAGHYQAAGDAQIVETLFRRYVSLVRVRGDSRTDLDLAAEFVTADPGSDRVAALVRRLPYAWRLGLWSGRRQVAAAGIALGALVGWSQLHTRQDEHFSEQRLMYSDSASAVRQVAVQLADGDGIVTPLVLRPATSVIQGPAVAYPSNAPAIAPDGRSVAWTQATGDSTTLDIWLRTPSGTRRLTATPRDDLVLGWLPDGSGVVGQSMRWSPRADGNYDIAVFDTATGDARQVTRGPAQDNHPAVSPDGSRIAFIRVVPDAPPTLCIVGIDGIGEPECRLIAGEPIAWLVGWVGLDELVLTSGDTDQRPLLLYDWSRDARTTLLGPYVMGGILSPDRRFVITSARVTGLTGFRDMVVPIAQPNRARPVEGPGTDPQAVRWWEGRPDRSLLIDRLEFTDSVHDVLPGIGTRLTVRALTDANVEVPLRTPIHWQSSDTAIMRIDSTGQVAVRGTGEVTVAASLGGWRSVAKRIRVVARPAITLLEEGWTSDWETRWLAWGDPAPTIRVGPSQRRGFWNRGDGVFPSVGILRQPLSAREGLGVEVQVATPLTGEPHQRMSVGLVGGVDLEAFAAADPTRAAPTVGGPESACSLIFPLEGRRGATRAGLRGGITREMDLTPSAHRLRTGAWWTLRLQIFPDGRCGIAINGNVIWRSKEPIPVDRPYRLWLGEESVGITLLHGPLTVWTGVRTDLAWGG